MRTTHFMLDGIYLYLQSRVQVTLVASLVKCLIILQYTTCSKQGHSTIISVTIFCFPFSVFPICGCTTDYYILSNTQLWLQYSIPQSHFPFSVVCTHGCTTNYYVLLCTLQPRTMSLPQDTRIIIQTVFGTQLAVQEVQDIINNLQFIRHTDQWNFVHVLKNTEHIHV